MEDYRLAYFLNNVLNLDLVRIDDFVLFMESKKDNIEQSFELFETQDLQDDSSSFPAYYYEDDLYKLIFLMLKNNSKGNFLIKDKNNADYLFILFNNYDFPLEKFFNEINKIQGVTASYKIEYRDSYGELLEEIEEHLIGLNDDDPISNEEEDLVNVN
jgi:hypothetical protein